MKSWVMLWRAGEFEQSNGDILTAQNPGFNVQVAREVEVALTLSRLAAGNVLKSISAWTNMA